MPPVLRVRHHDTIGHLSGGRFYPTQRAMDGASMRRAIKAGVAKGMAKAKSSSRDSKRDTADLAATIVRKLQFVADQRRAAIEAASHQDAGLVSAASGYVRDAEGKRLRPMRPADVQALADAHYGRGR